MITGRSVFILTLALGIGCDSPPPATDTNQISVDEASVVSIDNGLEDIDLWEIIDGEWIEDTSENLSIVKQVSVDRAFPVTILKKPVFSGVDVQVHFRPLSGKVDASGGIVFRATDNANYYVVRANSLEDNFRLYTVTDGKRHQIASTKVEAPILGEIHQLRVVVVGNHIQAYLNDELLIDHHDPTFAFGRVGLWTKADSVTEFSRFHARGVTTSNEE